MQRLWDYVRCRHTDLDQRVHVAASGKRPVLDASDRDLDGEHQHRCAVLICPSWNRCDGRRGHGGRACERLSSVAPETVLATAACAAAAVNVLMATS